MPSHHSHPYFSQLPTMQNRQDLAFALDRLPSMLTEFLKERRQRQCQQEHQAQQHQESQCTYPSPPPSPRSSVEIALPGYRGRSLSFSSVTSLSSSSSSTYTSSSSLYSTCSASNPPESRRRRRQHRLIEKNIVLATDPLQQQHYPSSLPFRLQFRNRAQAMAFLIQLLKTMQISPEEQDEQQQSRQQQHQETAQEQGLVPCYVCGEWYPEQIALYDQETGHFVRVVDGKAWHEQQPPPSCARTESSGSWQHWNAELRVRAWLDQVVVVTSAVGHPKVQVEEEEEEEGEEGQRTEIKILENTTVTSRTVTPTSLPRSQESGGRPVSYLIPQEILDPSCRSPGFRIKDKATASPVPAAAATGPASTAASSPSASPRSSLQFTFTSERFRTAVQEASQEPAIKPTPAVTTASPIKEKSLTFQTAGEQQEKNWEDKQTQRKEAVVEEVVPWSCDGKDASPSPQPETALPTWPLQTPPSKVSKPRGPWSFVRTTWRRAQRALARPFGKPSKTTSTPFVYSTHSSTLNY
ncbi:hypothetical protein EMPS_05012 [Entomortierella parvispora]|uniref:Uncharacterized protein n=1 Tax=Entomortierella parvispora TaxID=205924 RepID=A0A9P3LW43_9FUNG|nr:hypothetical protein EMPS_05012 [Entomortierella parvispora]